MKVPIPMLPAGGGSIAAAVGIVLLIGVALYVAKYATTQPNSQPPR